MKHFPVTSCPTRYAVMLGASPCRSSEQLIDTNDDPFYLASRLFRLLSRCQREDDYRDRPENPQLELVSAALQQVAAPNIRASPRKIYASESGTTRWNAGARRVFDTVIVGNRLRRGVESHGRALDA